MLEKKGLKVQICEAPMWQMHQKQKAIISMQWRHQNKNVKGHKMWGLDDEDSNV